MAIDRITDGTVMRTEFQKPRESPSQFRPVQAVAQAFTQGSKGDLHRRREDVAEADLRHALQRGDDHHVERQQVVDRDHDERAVEDDIAARERAPRSGAARFGAGDGVGADDGGGEGGGIRHVASPPNSR